jgi:hypothetical protein
MNCEHCEKKLPELYCVQTVDVFQVNECGQKVDTGNKELYFCNYECSRGRSKHYLVKQKIMFIKQSKERAEELEKSYEDGDTYTLIMIHYYKAIVNFIRGKINEKTFKIFAQDAMEVGNKIADSVYLVIVRDTQYAIAIMAL